MLMECPDECISCIANKVFPNFLDTSNAHMPMYPIKNIFSSRMNKINPIPSPGKIYYKNYTSKLEANDDTIF